MISIMLMKARAVAVPMSAAGSGADAAPVQYVALDGGDIVGGGRMSYLVNIQPFVVVVEVVKFAVGEFFVPEIIEADGDDRANGGFDDDRAGNAAGIIVFGWFEEFLGMEIAPDSGEQNAHHGEAAEGFKGFEP